MQVVFNASMLNLDNDVSIFLLMNRAIVYNDVDFFRISV